MFTSWVVMQDFEWMFDSTAVAQYRSSKSTKAVPATVGLQRYWPAISCLLRQFRNRPYQCRAGVGVRASLSLTTSITCQGSC